MKNSATPDTEKAAVRLEGRLSVMGALAGGRRKIERLFVDRAMDERRKFELKDAAWRAGVKIEWRKRPDLDNMTGSKQHGGVLALAGLRSDPALKELTETDNLRFVVMLDGVEDPYSYGHCVRAFYTAGVDLLIRSPREWGAAEATIARASGGCSELINTAVAEVQPAADWCRERGFQILTSAKTENSVSLFDVEFGAKNCLLVGGEKRGVTRSFLTAADKVISIPYGRETEISLGTVAAGSILAYEVMRRAGIDGSSTGSETD